MSKFDKIFQAREEGKEQSQNQPSAKKKSPGAAKKDKITEKKDSEKKSPVQLKEAESKKVLTREVTKQRGRPPAKRSDPDYLGFTTYIRRDTHLKAKIALLQEGKGRELSELVEMLLVEWLKKNS